jgi:hypothetical protein
MSRERLKQIAIALGVLIFLWGAVEIFRGDFDRPEQGFRMPVVTAAATDSIVFERAADTLVLVNHGAAWTVNGYRVQANLIPQFFDALADAPPAQLISQNPETHARLEIDDASARSFAVHGEGASVRLLVGKRGSNYQDVYFRRAGETEVYSVRTGLATYVDRQLSEWRDRNISAISQDSVGSAAIRRGGARYAIERGDSAWTFSDGAAADSAEVARFLTQFGALVATGFPTPAEADSITFDAPERRTVLLGLAGDTLLDMAFDSVAGKYWARHTGDTTTYWFSSFLVDRLAPADSTLRGN